MSARLKDGKWQVDDLFDGWKAPAGHFELGRHLIWYVCEMLFDKTVKALGRVCVVLTLPFWTPVWLLGKWARRYEK